MDDLPLRTFKRKKCVLNRKKLIVIAQLATTMLLFLFLLQPCLEVDFFYFGLRFCHLKVKTAETRKRIRFNKFTELVPQGSEMERNIQQDVGELNANEVGGKNGYVAGGDFVKLGDKNVYVYQHIQSAQCSRTTLSQLEGYVGVVQEQVRGGVDSCACSSHFILWPFFVGNQTVLNKYKAIPHRNPNIQSEIDKLERIIQGEESKETPYFTPSSYAFNWQENDWTMRLVPGIRQLFPSKEVTFTANLGPSWSTGLFNCLRVQDIAIKDLFLFRGSPDIVIGKKTAVNAAQLRESSSSEEEELVENSRQPTPMQGKDEAGFPERLGEVFACLHILLVSKILRNIGKQKAILREFKVRGMLLSKVFGGIQCVLRVQLKKNESSDLLFQLTAYNDLLEPSSLCTLLHNLIDPL